MCQCFVRISFKFGKARLSVTDKGCIVYHNAFVGGAVVFDWVGQPSEFSVWQVLFCIFY